MYQPILCLSLISLVLCYNICALRVRIRRLAKRGARDSQGDDYED
jgi:hypothetical protein